MSGGVDSCASALFLREAGYEPVGVRLILHEREDSLDSERLDLISKKFDMEIHSIDARDIFRERVIRDFLDAYESLRTPNPCVICNERVKFKLLFDEASKMGIDKVATGHYAGKGIYKGRDSIIRAKDRRKDQSYMLYRLPREWIGRILFPLEQFKKENIRIKVAEELGHRDMGEGDSQDICFIPGDVTDYLEDNLKKTVIPGDMVNLNGEVLGRHGGLSLYTIGQRKGLGLGGGPWFVVAKDDSHNRLILGRKEDSIVATLKCDMITLQHEVNVHSHYSVQHRYRSGPVEAEILSLKGDKMDIRLDTPAFGVAPGQSLVIYDDNVLIGGGIIIDTE